MSSGHRGKGAGWYTRLQAAKGIKEVCVATPPPPSQSGGGGKEAGWYLQQDV